MSINKNNFRTKSLAFKQKGILVDNGVVIDNILYDLGLLADEINAVISGATLIKKSYTVGLAEVPDCDYNFTAPANTTEQSIQLGGTTIIPALSSVASLIASCDVALVGGTATSDIGITSGSDEYVSSASLSSLNETASSGAIPASGVATSIYFSISPSANWSTLSAAKWIINFYYVI